MKEKNENNLQELFLKFETNQCRGASHYYPVTPLKFLILGNGGQNLMVPISFWSKRPPMIEFKNMSIKGI